MSSLEEKKAAIAKSRTFHDENTQWIRFDANIPKTVVFPGDWQKYMTYKTKDFTDDKTGEIKYVTYTCYKVHNPNAQDALKLRDLEASPTLDAQIGECLTMALEKEDYDGAVIATILKKQTGNSRNVTWSVRGDRFDINLLKPKQQGEEKKA